LPESPALAYKAYEIEELVDIYFYRRAGYVVAHAARLARLTPNAVSIVAALVGALGGGLVASTTLAPAGVALLVLHGIIDSADGQLARLTGKTSELGRILDGVSGYVTHVAIYLAIVAVIVRQGGPAWMIGVAVMSGVCTGVHAQMYDYFRTLYAAIAIKGRAQTGLSAGSPPPALAWLVITYASTQRALVGLHADVEARIASHAVAGVVQENDRARYRACFYRTTCGWNLLGDNMRRYAVAICVLLQHPAWFIGFTLGPMNAVLVVLWLMQRQADRRFLAASASAWPGIARA
jgi:phosphatidylglycerophosphate synthase